MDISWKKFQSHPQTCCVRKTQLWNCWDLFLLTEDFFLELEKCKNVKTVRYIKITDLPLLKKNRKYFQTLNRSHHFTQKYEYSTQKYFWLCSMFFVMRCLSSTGEKKKEQGWFAWRDPRIPSKQQQQIHTPNWLITTPHKAVFTALSTQIYSISFTQLIFFCSAAEEATKKLLLAN